MLNLKRIFIGSHYCSERRRKSGWTCRILIIAAGYSAAGNSFVVFYTNEIACSDCSGLFFRKAEGDWGESLPDTELSENIPQQIIRCDLTGDFAKMHQRFADILCEEIARNI